MQRTRILLPDSRHNTQARCGTQRPVISAEAKAEAARSPVVRGQRAAMMVIAIGTGASLLTWLALAIAGSELRHVALGIGGIFACGSVGVMIHSVWWLSR